MGSNPAVQSLGSSAEHPESFLLWANVGMEGAEEGAAGGARKEDRPSWHR